MHEASVLLLWASLALVVFQVIAVTVQSLRRASTARRLGCKKVPFSPNPVWDPLGIHLLRRAINATKEQNFPGFMNERYLEECARAGRNAHTFDSSVLAKHMLFTCEPKNIQALLALQFHDFELGKARRGNFMPLLGNGIFTSDGKAWEHSRALLRPNFAREQISDLELEEKHVQDMMKALPVNGDGWTDELDLQVLFFRLTLDSATEFLFGESVDSQLAELPSNAHTGVTKSVTKDEKLFAWTFDRAQQWLAWRARFSDRYWLCTGAEFRQVNKHVHNFVDHFVQLALNHELKEKLLEEGGNKPQPHEKYIFLNALAKQTRDPIELRSQLLNILLAGRDTTASLLGWLFYLLARHPAVFAKLRQTIIHEFGEYSDEKARDNITFATLKSCQYLQHCLNETLRIYPVVPANSRRAAKDTSIPLGGGPQGLDPVFVPAGTEVNYSVHVMHHRKDLWGPDADEFKPERWHSRRPGWEYLPFNGGPRICLGQQFALTEASYVTVRLLQRFDKIENRDFEPVKCNLTLTMCSGTGVKVKLREAGT